MSKKYKKICYNAGLGYGIHHTTGISAEESTVGHLHYPAGFLFYYFVRGSATMKIDGKHYDVGEGYIMILNPSELFCCAVNENTVHERIVLHINEMIMKNFPMENYSLFMPFYKCKGRANNRIPAETVRKYGLDTEFKNLLNIVSSSETENHILALCKTIEVLVQIGKLYSSNELINETHKSVNPLIDKVLYFLNHHFSEDITIKQIALNFNVDRSYLSHLFKEYTGVSLWNYVIFRRISLFNNLIKKGCSIEETSRKVGFQNYSNFFRLYKKHMHMTPTEFKRQIDCGE